MSADKELVAFKNELTGDPWIDDGIRKFLTEKGRTFLPGTGSYRQVIARLRGDIINREDGIERLGQRKETERKAISWDLAIEGAGAGMALVRLLNSFAPDDVLPNLIRNVPHWPLVVGMGVGAVGGILALTRVPRIRQMTEQQGILEQQLVTLKALLLARNF